MSTMQLQLGHPMRHQPVATGVTLFISNNIELPIISAKMPDAVLFEYYCTTGAAHGLQFSSISAFKSESRWVCISTLCSGVTLLGCEDNSCTNVVLDDSRMNYILFCLTLRSTFAVAVSKTQREIWFIYLYWWWICISHGQGRATSLVKNIWVHSQGDRDSKNHPNAGLDEAQCCHCCHQSVRGWKAPHTTLKSSCNISFPTLIPRVKLPRISKQRPLAKLASTKEVFMEHLLKVGWKIPLLPNLHLQWIW